ncbi:MAG: RDD family protein [Deltaproteobacteria bacterium]|nr:RDD family protein [Deltaproteobacteria bacterium]
MANRSAPPPDSGELLNLPLERPSDGNQPLGAQDLLPFESSREPVPPEHVDAGPKQSSEPTERRGGRLQAGLLDLGVVGGATLLALIGALALGIRLGPEKIPALVVFALSFSFLYTVVPLTFWGQTPGMAAAGLVARGHEGAALTIQQVMRRWLANLLTVALLGLPALMALTGRSFADRLSSSQLEPR